MTNLTQNVSMRPEQIEALVLRLVDTVARGDRIENSRVELKADWPDPIKAARRIAAHANASGAETVLWVIGLDEAKTIAIHPPKWGANSGVMSRCEN